MAADNARAAMNSALQEFAALPPFADTPSDPGVAQLVRSHQSVVERRLRTSLDVINRLERVAFSYAAWSERTAAREQAALADALVLSFRQEANETRLRAHLTPHVPWVEPVDNAVAELADGMASLMEMHSAFPQRQAQFREAIQLNVDRLRGYLRQVEAALQVETSDSETAAVLGDLTPSLSERMTWLGQAAAELEAAAQTSDADEQGERLRVVSSLYRQTAASPQSALR